MAYNKIIYKNDVLIDLTNDTVRADNLYKGYTAHLKSGVQVTGTASRASVSGQKLILTFPVI